jgi:hypothetical protein
MKELAIFTAPKPFTDPHVDLIQRNAIRSWLQMGAAVEVFLVGDEAGMAAVARELGVKQLSGVRRNAHGTPLVSSIFELARAASQAPVLAYVNTDVLLFPETLDLVCQAQILAPDFLLLGRRHDLEVRDELDFSPGWEGRLKAEVAEDGELHAQGGSDYFIFPRQLYQQLPDFAIGRAGWDNWMIYHAVTQPWPALDVTPSLMVVHQQHDYGHLPEGKAHYKVEETYENTELAGGMRHIYSLLDVDAQLLNGRIRPAPDSLARRIRGWERRLQPDERVGRGWRWFLIRRLRKLRRALLGRGKL